MRIVQIIDSLDAGGAERMAVNYANALAKKTAFSGLVATRKEGSLITQIDSKVPYLFLEKKKSIDLKAVFKLKEFTKKNKIDIVHAHGSSFFIAVLLKLIFPRIKIIWHDHYGSRVKESVKQNKILISMSVFFSSIFVVNLQLKDWNQKNMKCSKVIFIPNFASVENVYKHTTILKGIEGKKIIFLANLKNPKNHILILKAFKELNLNELGWSLHLIGKDYYDSYSDEIKIFIKSYSLENDIHLYGEKNDIKFILSQASIGVLASTEEGFPVTLLEYASENLPVVSTNVGYCSALIKDGFSGLLFNPFSSCEVKDQLSRLVNDDLLKKKLGDNFKQAVMKNYSEEVVIEKLILAYKNK
nr:glycosyltransferase [uncultured Flavobacterium sp.]